MICYGADDFGKSDHKKEATEFFNDYAGRGGRRNREKPATHYLTYLQIGGVPFKDCFRNHIDKPGWSIQHHPHTPIINL